MRSFRQPCLVCLLWLGLATAANAEPEIHEEARQAQRSQAELQARIDAADDASRAMLEELRELERAERRLARENAELAPRIERQAESLNRREQALDTLEETRDALPALEARLVDRLEQWIESDMPFLRQERLARVASLRSQSQAGELSVAERWERIIEAWRAELDYGRDVDAWRGYLGEGESRREVDYLRLGRVGFYYLTPDGRAGRFWQADAGSWAALDEAQRREVRNGLRIARDRRAPELLNVPLSQPLESVEDDT
ncbi:MAG: DUF3450 domain-containing protein [Halomonas sp.]|mgnify:CR=1 FL=1|uniref:DUF3450 domain-containing protein n=2 Tax=Halomonadaceae TaxID=28256 RepID=A0ABS6ZQ64_9GAMM|nr:DUF3450 domain-containing protein [Halomonas sulfidivorans]MBW6392173.1 DUF3450 domain-containing protein [Halomonas antri]MDX5377368.1 DUF3450 domain-containing protein [Halomonas sp.]MDX5502825.1 DUF3450 domain-containing protein [Halomonas sp.]QTP58737.1 DUF3450 domain-containing protein [Halomonas sulfidivorans]